MVHGYYILLPMTEFCLNLLTVYLTAVLIMMYTSIEGTIIKLSITNNFTLWAATSCIIIHKYDDIHWLKIGNNW